VLGVWIFGEGFIHAFRYLLFPDQGGRASGYYPTNASRAEFIMMSSEEFGDQLEYSLSGMFPVDDSGTDKLLALADESTRALVPNLIAKVKEHCEKNKKTDFKRKTGSSTLLTINKASQ
jgi:hypothetical protein